MLNMHDNRGSFRSVATTSYLGASWTEHQTSYKDLPDPVVICSLIKADGEVKVRHFQLLFLVSSYPIGMLQFYN